MGVTRRLPLWIIITAQIHVILSNFELYSLVPLMLPDGLWLKTNRVHLCYRSHLHTDKCQAALSDRRCTSLWYWREREAKKKEKKEDTERRHVLFMIAMWFKLSPLTLTPQLHPRIEFPGLSKSPHLRRSLYSHALPTARPSLPPPTNRFFSPLLCFSLSHH